MTFHNIKLLEAILVTVAILIAVTFLLGCATTPTYENACRHEPIIVAMILIEKGYPVRIYWGPAINGTHIQTQAFRENDWCWASYSRGKVIFSEQDYWFKPQKTFTFKEYMDFWFKHWKR